MAERRRRINSHRFCIFPGYNWCGPGCSGPGAPINEVDAACRAHDKCYEQRRNRCFCDREFLNQLTPYINQYGKTGKHARLLYHYMRLQSTFTCRPNSRYRY